MKFLMTFIVFSPLIWIQNHQEKVISKKYFTQQGINNVEEIRIKNILTEVNGREVFISYPQNVKESHTYPVVMAIHGSGREARSYRPGDEKSVDFYIHQRDLAVRNGCMFVVLSNGIDTWGTDEGLQNLEKLYDFIQSNFYVEKKWILWATSAGGTLMYRYIKKYPEIVSKAIGIFPVYNIEDSINRSKGAKKMWSKRTQKLKRINPSEFPEALTEVPILIFHGKDDEVVPPKFHSQQLQKEVNSKGGEVTLYMVDGGHSTNNWNVYKDKIIIKFLNK